MPNEIDMKIRLSKSLLSEARKAATPSPQGPASLNSSETTTVSDLLRKPIPIPSPIWVRIPIPLVYPRPHFPSLSISLSLAAAFHSSACCDHLFPINCAMSPATLDFYCWPWSKRPSKQLAYILFSYFYPPIYPHFLSICCLFFWAKSSQMQRFCGSYPVCCDIKLHLHCRLQTIFQRQLELWICGAPAYWCVCVCVGGVANVFVIAIWCMTHGICVIPLNIMQNVQDFRSLITYTILSKQVGCIYLNWIVVHAKKSEFPSIWQSNFMLFGTRA